MVAASKFSTRRITLSERTSSPRAILLIEAYTPGARAVPQKRAVFYFLFYFRLFSGPPLDAGRKTRETLDLPMKKANRV
jgi:hypothetical protein